MDVIIAQQCRARPQGTHVPSLRCIPKAASGTEERQNILPMQRSEIFDQYSYDVLTNATLCLVRVCSTCFRMLCLASRATSSDFPQTALMCMCRSVNVSTKQKLPTKITSLPYRSNRCTARALTSAPVPTGGPCISRKASTWPESFMAYFHFTALVGALWGITLAPMAAEAVRRTS